MKRTRISVCRNDSQTFFLILITYFVRSNSSFSSLSSLLLQVAVDTGTMTAHQVAAAGDLDALMLMAEENPDSIHKKDQNGWQ